MKNFQLSSVIKVITMPNNTFREIFEDVDNYFKASIIILVLSSFFTITLPVTLETSSELTTNELGYILDAEIQILDSIVSIVGGFLTIVIILYIVN